MLIYPRDAYVKMKVKEKGIPESEIHKGKTGANQNTGKWNAFKEMNKLKTGGHPMLAKIPDDDKVVGKPSAGLHGRDTRKRQRDDDDQEASAGKKEKVEVGLHYRRLENLKSDCMLTSFVGDPHVHAQLQGQGPRVRQGHWPGRRP